MRSTTAIWTLTACAVGVVWWAFESGIATLLVAPLVVLGFPLVLLVRCDAPSKWLAVGVFLIALPIPVTAVRTMAGYASGSAVYVHGFGKTTAAIHNIARDTRYPGTTGPCSSGFAHNRTLLIGTSNATLRALHAIFGPMPGTYAGPYPTIYEAAIALQSGEPVAWSQLNEDNVVAKGQRTRLRLGVGRALVAALQSEDTGSPRATIWQDQVLLLELPVADAREPLLAFIDRVSGKVFAYAGSLPKNGWSLPRQWE